MTIRFIIVLCLLFPVSTAWANTRVALVVGNSNYKIGRLTNPKNDAQDVAQQLRQLGFKVELVLDANRTNLHRAVQRFRSQLSGNTEVALMFYAGHGAQYGEQSYLLPLHANIKHASDLSIEALRATDVLSQMRATGSRVNVMVLDACRDLPFPALNRTTTRGLARVQRFSSSLVAFSTAPGSVASDGRSRNSPYTTQLLKHLKKPNLPLTQLFNDVGYAVERATGGKQSPWINSSPMPAVYLAGKQSTQAQVNNVARPQTQVAPQSTPSNRANSNTHSHNGRSHTHPLPAQGVNHQHNGSAPAPDPREPDMAFIRGGTFMMGSPANEAERDDNERQHSVTVGNFYLGKTEVTNAEYARCVSAGSCKPPEWQETGSKYNLQTGTNKGYQGFTSPIQPVVGVSWHNAQSYAKWLSSTTGKRYGLPTEAQWEYAARAGTKTAYPWGNQISRSQANYGAEECCKGKASGADRWVKAAPVGSFPANRFGLKDMQGNVYEWTCSAYDKNYNGSEQRCAPASDARQRVLRGGSWISSPDNVRFAVRDWLTAAYRDFNVGFRLSRTP